MEDSSNLVQNYGDLATSINDLKDCMDQMEGREALEMNGWLQKVKDREVEVRRLRKDMDKFKSGRGFKKISAQYKLNMKVLENLRAVKDLKEEFEDVVVAAVRVETINGLNSLKPNVEAFSRQMVVLKHIKHQVATREGRDMDEWLEKVEGREREFDEIREEFEFLRSGSCKPFDRLKALETLSGKVCVNLKAVNLLIDEGNASLESNPGQSNKLEHKIFSREELIKFTSDFEEIVGSGGFSIVYKGKLHDGKQVAVKVLTDTVVIGDFMAEMQTMITAFHPNLVTLHGFCFDFNMKALVYEFMKKGSLDKILFHNGHLNLEWGNLYEISLQTAKGLAYLHNGCSKQIIHRDVKPANVLLDESLSPKITDFGLARLISKDANHYTKTQNQGTPAYMAPEIGNPTSNITKDCDVYSFGVMLFEVLGKRCNGQFGLNWFPIQVWRKYEEGQLDELIESCGIMETHKSKAKILSMVALWCVQYTVEIRPSMSIVVEVLDKEISVNSPPYPFEFYKPPLDFSMIPSEDVIHSEASVIIQESFSNPPVVAAPEVFINEHQELGKKEEAEKESYDDDQVISNFSEQVVSEENKTNSETEKLPSEMVTCRPQQFSLSDLVSFTSNFSEEIGKGAFGVVCKGQLPNGVKVAIEVLNDIDISDKTFLDVVMSRAKLYHPKIVKQYGYCLDLYMKALVYEYMENGSLDMMLYNNHLHLKWGQLHGIAIETAKALSILHNAGIIHHHIKASNILLSSNLSPKIKCSGLEQLMEKDDVSHLVVTRDSEAISYGAPELWIPTSVVTSKSDVYSFGMLLFEVLGRRSISNQHGQEWFPAQVWTKIHKGLKDQLMDDCRIGENDREDALCLSLVALLCAQSNPQKRPSMSTVVYMLDSKIQIVPPSCPFIPMLSAIRPSTSLLPEMSPSFYSEVSPFFEPSFLEKTSLEDSNYSLADSDDKTRELKLMLHAFGENCPPGGKNSVVLYTAVGWQGRFTDCTDVCSILKSHRIEIFERDIGVNTAYLAELKKLLGSTEVPALFVHGRFIGGVNEVKNLEEEGKLEILLYGIPVERVSCLSWCTFYFETVCGLIHSWFKP